MRSTLMARKDITERLSYLAQREGKPLYSIVNDLIERYLDLRNRGYELGEVLDSFYHTKMAQEIGWVVVPYDLFKHCVAELYGSAKDVLRQIYYNSGTGAGKYVQSQGSNGIAALEKLEMQLNWNALKYDCTQIGNGLVVRLSNPFLQPEHMDLQSSFTEGYMREMGYLVVKKDVFEGFSVMTFSKTS